MKVINIHEDIVKSIVSKISETKNDLDRGKDLRIVLTHIPELQSIFKGQIDLAQDPETRFISYLFFGLLGLMGTYEGKTDNWYSLNSGVIKTLREKLSTYLEKVIVALEKKDYDAFLESTKEWFSEFHTNTRKTTVDVKP